MLIHNSQTKFYLELLTCIYHDVVSAQCSQREGERDLVEIRRRVACEGLSFLTKTLPALGKSVDKSLASGAVLQFSNFKRRKGTQLPQFMRTLFERLFTTDGIPLYQLDTALVSQQGETGSTKPPGAVGPNFCREAQVIALRAIRQVCGCFYKLNIPFSNEQREKVCEDFVQAEIELNELDSKPWRDDPTIRQARKLIARILCNVSPLQGLPKHGPGAVATGEKIHQKHLFARYYRRLAAVFSYDKWFFFNENHLSEELDKLQSMQEAESGHAKVVLVPKDSRGPRLISCEPLEYQWVQQALKRVLVDTIEKHPLTRRRINFSDQTCNRMLALEGSRPPYRWVTLDMKEASDRVHLELVKALFPPNWYDALYASRSSHTRLPNGKLVALSKFAPMGSAVCFPVEALIFWAISVASISIKRNTPLRKVATKVFVYGDDIIVDSVDHRIILDTLPLYGLKLNNDKCCVAGPFKESCGEDAFFGQSVTPLRVRKTWSNRREPSTLASYVALSNALWERGCFESANYIEHALKMLYRRKTKRGFIDMIPSVSGRNPSVIAFVRPGMSCRYANRNCKTRWNNQLHRAEIYGYALRPLRVNAEVDGYALMLRVHTDKHHMSELCDAFGFPKAHEPPISSIVDIGEPGCQTGQYAIAHRVKPSRAWTLLDN